MSVEENKALVRTLIKESERRGEFPSELCTPDFTVNQAGLPPMDAPGMNKHVMDIKRAFPDIRYRIEWVIAEGDMVAVRFLIEGTHTGDLEGIPVQPSGRKISIVNHAFGRIEDGKVAEWWTSPDSLGLMQQLGAIPRQ